jgi:hypothetical protein
MNVLLKEGSEKREKYGGFNISCFWSKLNAVTVNRQVGNGTHKKCVGT